MEFQLLVCVVKNDDIVEEILTGFIELGVGGATVITARGMAEIISSQLPLFAGFKDVFQAGGTSRIILAALLSDLVPEVLRFVRSQLESESNQGGEGVAFTIPIAAVVGLQRQVLED